MKLPLKSTIVANQQFSEALQGAARAINRFADEVREFTRRNPVKLRDWLRAQR